MDIASCKFCSSPIIKQNQFSGTRKYCSTICIKRAHAHKAGRNKLSRFNPNGVDPLYWETPTGKGYVWEKFAAKLLNGVHVNAETMNRPFDVDVNGATYDIKVSTLYKRKLKRGKPYGLQKTINGTWSFKIQPNQTPDFFFCICLDGASVVKILKIPRGQHPTLGLCIGHQSKYDKFIFPIPSK